MRKLNRVFPRGSCTNGKRAPVHNFRQRIGRKRHRAAATKIFPSRMTPGIRVLSPKPIVQSISIDETLAVLVGERRKMQLRRGLEKVGAAGKRKAQGARVWEGAGSAGRTEVGGGGGGGGAG